MRAKKTDLLDFNFRREVFPGLTETQYELLQAGEVVELEEETATIMLERGLIQEEN